MNNKIIIIIILAFMALAILTLYSFGPLAGKKRSEVINPISKKPLGTEQMPVNNQPVQFNRYYNKDIKENYYKISLPKSWQVQSGKRSGSYTFTFPEGSGNIQLLDVPDNSTLELFILSQQEPWLKKSLANYARKDYNKTMINSNEAYELTIDNTDSGQSVSTIKIYIAGQDNAVVATFIVKKDKFEQMSTVFTSIINSFFWENK